MNLDVYTVHKRPSAGADPDVVLVREGYSFWAFLFQVGWALWHRMWLAAAGLFALSVGGIQFLEWSTGAGPAAQAVFQIAIALLVGATANDLRRWTLERQGYDLDAVVIGETKEDAEQRYFSHGGCHAFPARPHIPGVMPGVVP